MNEDRSSLVLGDEAVRSFQNATNGRRFVEDEWLDRKRSTSFEWEGEQDSSKVVNSFFETKDKLEWGVE